MFLSRSSNVLNNTVICQSSHFPSKILVLTGIPLHTTGKISVASAQWSIHTLYLVLLLYKVLKVLFMRRTLSKRSGWLLHIALWNSFAYYACIAPCRIRMFHSHTTGYEQLGKFLSRSVSQNKKGKWKDFVFIYWLRLLFIINI